LIFIEIYSNLLNESHLLWNFLAILITGVNISMIFEKKEMNSLINSMKNSSELDSLKFEHKVYKISKKLMNSLKFMISLDKNDYNLRKTPIKYPEILTKFFIKFPIKDEIFNIKELENMEKNVIETSLSAENIAKIEFSRNIELLLSPHFEDFYGYNLMKSRDQYMILSEILARKIKRVIEEKIDSLKTESLFGRIYGYIGKIQKNFIENIMDIEKKMENLRNDIEKIVKEMDENKEKIEEFNNEINRRVFKGE